MENPQSLSPVLVRRDGPTTHVTLNRPEKLNALNPDLVERLISIVSEACHDGTRLMVLEGAGRSFSAGFDLSGYEDQSEGDLVLRFIRMEVLLQAVYHAPFQTLALAHGKNFGAGVDLICSCSRRYAASDTTFRMPGLRFGLVLGTRRLAQRVGNDRAREFLATSKVFGSQEAQHSGFIQAMHEPHAWPGLIVTAAEEATMLTADASTALLRVTAPDTRSDDLADLVRSASEPGLKERLRRYRAQP